MEPLTWTTKADPPAVLAAAHGALAALGYSVTTDQTGWAGGAEVGSKAARALAGGLARRMILTWALTQAETPDALRLVVSPAATGWSGGALGASKAKKEVASVGEAVHQALVQQGLLVG